MANKTNTDITPAASSSQSSSKKSNKKRMTTISLALMAFTCLWGFGNITNGYAYFGGTQAIVPWILVFLLYFLPYVLMVGELGAMFKDKAGGVSSWILETIGPKIAFFCGWIYWIVHMPYLAQKPSNIIVSMNWAIFNNGDVSSYPVWMVQLIGLAIFLVCLFLATRGIKVINKIASIAGAAAFVLSLLYILMVFSAPAITGVQFNPIELKLENFMPKDWSMLLNLSILIFAVGGCEKMSPYVNQLKNPGRQFPSGMMIAMGMVILSAILGTVAMGFTFNGYDMSDPAIQKEFLTNGQYYAFLMLGEYYGLGSFFVLLFALSNAITMIAVLIISIDAPLRIMLGNADKKFIPSAMFKQNKNGCYTNGVKLVGVLVTLLILIPCLGIGDVPKLVKSLIDLNAVCMPIRYLFVFLAYIALKKAGDKFGESEYKFTKRRGIGIFWGCWCFGITAICCIMKMVNVEDPFLLLLNILTPVILIGIGFIMPGLALRERKKLAKTE